jgi:hypothetical protein
MIWFIDDEEFVFSSWEELGMALRNASRESGEVSVRCGPICSECNGNGGVKVFLKNGVSAEMECGECNASGIKSWE